MKAHRWGEHWICTACHNDLQAATQRALAIEGIAGKAGAEWLVYDGHKQWGPYSTSQLIELLGTGRVQWMWMIWRDGMTNWTPAARLFVIAELGRGRIELRDFGQGDGTYHP